MLRQFQVDDLQVSFNGEKVLNHLSFEVFPGEMLAIIGPNGAGKSTLLKVILGMIHPQGGAVRMESDKRKAVIGYVPQSRTIDEETPIQAKDFVSLGLPAKIVPWLSQKERVTVKKAMMMTESLHLAKKPIGRLSGGERQRVFVAQAMVRHPDVLLLDESTANLDPNAQEQMMQLVQRLCKNQGITVLFICHDLHMVKEYSDRVLFMSRRHYETGSTDEVLSGKALEWLYHSTDDEKPKKTGLFREQRDRVTDHLF
ncbi:metal ABC transporter ATP-binding protein [Sporolactobacillus sp. THM7-7]|nr:metal ABC transporter ATP-binding protein [Sporolactobacillus sp. THM7-7]